MPPELTRLDARAKTADLLAALDRDGGVIVESYLDQARCDAIQADLAPYIQQTAPVPDDFAGRQTTRTGGLVVRSKDVRELLVEPFLLESVNAFLAPYTDKIQLNLTQIIRLLPGQGAQPLHRDRFIWGKSLPREVEPQLNTIWALDDFTEANGATRVVPGSHRWDWDRVPNEDEVTQAVMPRGSFLLYTGSVMHGGGENRSDGDRTAMNLTYVNAWLRQEENQYMTCPPEIAKDYSPELRALLGYTMANFGLGYYTPTEFTPGVPNTYPPEVAFSEAVSFEEAAAHIPDVKTF